MDSELTQAIIQLTIFTIMVETATELLPKLPIIKWIIEKVSLTKPSQAVIYSVSITLIFQYGAFARIVGVDHVSNLSIYADYVLTGLVVARGSAYIHEKLSAALRKAKAVAPE